MAKRAYRALVKMGGGRNDYMSRMARDESYDPKFADTLDDTVSDYVLHTNNPGGYGSKDDPRYPTGTAGLVRRNNTYQDNPGLIGPVYNPTNDWRNRVGNTKVNQLDGDILAVALPGINAASKRSRLNTNRPLLSPKDWADRWQILQELHPRSYYESYYTPPDKIELPND